MGSETNKVFNQANDEEKKRIPRNRNLTWSAFEKINQFISSDRELKELMMSLVGAVIYGNLGELSVSPGHRQQWHDNTNSKYVVKPV